MKVWNWGTFVVGLLYVIVGFFGYFIRDINVWELLLLLFMGSCLMTNLLKEELEE